jgi:endonuclease YncB( thermonuclease family)
MSNHRISPLQRIIFHYRRLILVVFWLGMILLPLLLVVSCSMLTANQDRDQLLESNTPPVPTYIIAIPDTPTPIMQSKATLSPLDTRTTLPEREIAFVMRVIDGDTIEVILDGESYNLRYIGIDAPEMGMPFSQEATEVNQRLVENQIVELERDITETDRHGRLLRYVYLDDGSLVNAELVRLGVAIAHTYPPDIKHQELINDKEQEAKNAGAGFWAPATATPTISNTGLEMLLEIDPECSQFNAPGNDNDNKIEEYVCISNIGTALVEMSEWSVHDEYGWTFQFPEFSLEPGSKVRIITGCGEDTDQDLFWCKDETAVWNNDGDCAYLLDDKGELIANYCY